MTNKEKYWQQIDRELDQLKCVMNKEYCYQAIVLNLVKIVKEQQEQIDSLQVNKKSKEIDITLHEML